MLANLNFFISEAFIGMRRSGLMTMITIATMTISLIVFGFFLLISLNMNNLSTVFSSQLEMRVYLKDNLTQGEISQFKNRLLNINHIKSVEFISRDQAWTQFQDNFKNLNLSDLVDENPLPHSFRVKLRDNKNISKLSRYIGTFIEFVDEVGYHGVLAERIALFATFSRLSGLVLVGFLTLATLLIIMNTIRLTIIARTDEVTIMKLVGATHQFIRWPFLIEGLLIGIIGSLLATVLLKYAYDLFGEKMQLMIPFFPIVSHSATLNLMFLVIIALGTGLGILGAYISISRTLKSIV